MKRKNASRKIKSGRHLCEAASLFLLGFCLLAGTWVYASAGTIDVTVGYYGMEGYTKMSPTMDELRDNCGTNREIYTWIDNAPAAGTTEAEGVYLEDIMEYCGIDADFIGYYHFYTLDADSYEGAWDSHPSDSLNGGATLAEFFKQALEAYNNRASDEDFAEHPENYYRLCNFYNGAEERGAASFTPEVWQQRVRVKPMLALSKYSVRWSGDYPASALDFEESKMSSENMPQLLFGQSAANEITRYNMAKMVSRIHVWFEGSPTITSSIEELEGEIGSSSQIEVEVDTPDAYLTQKIKENIRWTSNDESVATVDDDGNVTFVGEGEVSFSASYTYVDMYGSEHVDELFSVGGTSKAGTEEQEEQESEEPEQEEQEKPGTEEQEEQESEEPEQEEQEEPGQEPRTDKNGGGNGNGTKDDGGTGSAQSGMKGKDTGKAETSGRMGGGEGKYYLADAGNSEPVQKVAGGGSGVKVYGFKDDMEGLPEMEEENPATKAAAALAAVLLASGILGEGLTFKYQKTRR